MLMGLLSVWNRNVLGHASQAVIPYDQRLGALSRLSPAIADGEQRQERRRDGAPVARRPAPVVWGEPGTNGQHAFFQLLHQGTEIVPVDFLVAAKPTDADAHHHDLLRRQLLRAGRGADARAHAAPRPRRSRCKQGASADEAARLAPHKTFSGSRPSSTLLYRQLDPRTLGRLIALYEHKVFVEAAIWDINPFDQWGVELGKELASRLAPIVADPTPISAPSTLRRRG